jgi:hypothetical protein
VVNFEQHYKIQLHAEKLHTRDDGQWTQTRRFLDRNLVCPKWPAMEEIQGQALKIIFFNLEELTLFAFSTDERLNKI